MKAKELDQQTVQSSELVEQTFDFWFNGKEHIRSPFPEYIRPELEIKATKSFFEWAGSLDKAANEEVDDEFIGEKFEEIIFETALTLVLTEDEKITIKYPFMPRIGDENNTDMNGVPGRNVIIGRTLVKEGDHLFLRVKLETAANKEIWETKFELPL